MSKFFKILLITAVLLDVLSAYFEDFIPRYITFFVPIPLIVINYSTKVKQHNVIYLLSFSFTYIATTLYYLTTDSDATLSYSSIAIVFYSIGLAIYNYLVFKKIKYRLREFIQFIVLYAICLAMPIYFFFRQLRTDDFISMIIYSINTILFFQITYILREKEKRNNLAFTASCIFLFSSFCSGVYFFHPIEALKIFKAIDVATFWTMHILFSLYMIKNSKPVNAEK